MIKASASRARIAYRACEDFGPGFRGLGFRDLGSVGIIRSTAGVMKLCSETLLIPNFLHAPSISECHDIRYSGFCPFVSVNRMTARQDE